MHWFAHLAYRLQAQARNEETRARLVNEAPTSLSLSLSVSLSVYLYCGALGAIISARNYPLVERVSRPTFAISYPALRSTPPFVSHDNLQYLHIKLYTGQHK
ncbi:hypothetical protein FOZG_14885 [Fusarium oxysporum Fo47]|uniref:Uncharacterized protein n=1 Tax=Fusarium oxysporum Fo47 TaxID=660027 RepID=W9JIN8_FUSOX|nr:hypothetical protein FOZG_14885 [Fusarium oxysporum Fo47]EWZ31812.1 hypothetical protein FOZG_14885 [Fusarium oxysporum Fo47]EWZ31813.1 hypothetical protein FOZG_14885 [Fusarium oxysporum Fo47]EWZ31814.1 hypothetical protein FOZG_14885 [Fusarium oxysporum Fo47]EWZ31815.1 hypothetical protein FOZG_14885 [Fusarium oxysporum Fo47]